MLASPSRAGTYFWTTKDDNGNITAQSPSFSGGTAFGLTSNSHGPFIGFIPYSFGSSNTYGGGGGHVSNPSCSGAITATLTWQADPTKASDPPPPSGSVIVTETCTASASAQVGANATCNAKCDDGMGQPGSTQSVSGTPNYYDTSTPPQPTQYLAKVSATDTRYTVQGGATITLTLSPSSSATASAPNGPGGWQTAATISYAVNVYPVTIGVGGATSDNQGGWDVLVGMPVSPFLIGIPGSCTVSNYQWTVTGTTMQSWTVSSDMFHTMEADGSGPLNIESPKWFWNDKSPTSETIICTATVTPPNGQGAPFTITATQPVGVYLPVLVAKALGGQMIVDVNEPGSKNSADFWLHAAPSANTSQPGGMTLQVDLAPPQNAPVKFDQGNIYLAQTITPDVHFIDKTDQEYEDIFQGQLGVDTNWPYPWAAIQDPPYQPDYVQYDDPGMDLTALNAIYGAEESSFEDYIMFQPYGSPDYVPLASFKWSINGTVTIPGTNNWADYRNPAGTVEPSGSPTPFTRDNTYPSWTQNSGNVADSAPAFKPF